MTGPQPRNGIMDLPPYVGGKESLPGQEKIFKLSANENPLGASPNALEAYRMAGENLEIYPDGHSMALREALRARVLSAAPRRLCTCSLARRSTDT